MKKALIAMSGGVDSSVTAYLVKEMGYECVGCTMKLHSNKNIDIEDSHTCSSADDVADARNVAKRLNMPHSVVDFSDLFKEKIIDYFVSSYENGITPNPCVECNRHMKFNKLYEEAKNLGCEYVATGHYARVEKTESGYRLLKALDPNKDQSYVLYSMTQEQLAHTLFPLGGMSKDETRKIAEENGFINANKPDSQDICFVPDGDYVKVIKRYSGKEYPEGDFKTADGEVLGRHKGIVAYTIGQRKGLGIAAKAPLYVCDIRPDTNEVILGSNDDLFSKEVNVVNVNWIVNFKPGDVVDCKAKVRYRHKEQPAKLYVLEDNKARLEFIEAQRAITPGQAAVFYDGDVVLGGGTIVR